MKDQTYAYLKSAKIAFEIFNHPALFACGDDDKYGIVFPGITCKNLFLRNRNKTRYYLVSLSTKKSISLSDLAAKLDEKRLNFASPEDLLEKLKVKPGSVSLLNLISVAPTDITFIIDKHLKKAPKVGFHPSDNTATVFISGESIETILKNFKANYKFLDL